MSGKKYFLIVFLFFTVFVATLVYALSIPKSVVSSTKNEKTSKQISQDFDIKKQTDITQSPSSTFSVQTKTKPQTVNEIIYNSYEYSQEQLEIFKKRHVYTVGKVNLFIQTVKDRNKIIKSSIYPSDTPDEDINNTSIVQQNISQIKSGDNSNVQNQ